MSTHFNIFFVGEDKQKYSLGRRRMLYFGDILKADKANASLWVLLSLITISFHSRVSVAMEIFQDSFKHTF